VTAESSARSDTLPWEHIGKLISKLSIELAVVLPKVRQAIKAGNLVPSELTRCYMVRY